MRQAFSFLLLLCSCWAPTFSQTVTRNDGPPNTASAPRSDTDDIRQMEDDWHKAEETTDVALLERILADDFVNLTPNGIGPGKAELVRTLHPRAGQAPPYTLETKDMRVYVFGDTGISSYTRTYTAKENGNSTNEQAIHVFIRDHGAWKLKLARTVQCEQR